MFGRLVTIAILIAAGYWYWSGPFQAQHDPGAQQTLEADIENMHQCTRGMHYKAGATGVGDGNPEEICAKRFNLYFYEGEWRSSSEP